MAPNDPDALSSPALRHFSTAQFLPGADLQALQTDKLRVLLRRAAGHVPMYRDLYRAHGVAIEDIQDANDLWRLPSVAKEDFLRAPPGSYVDERHALESLTTRATSGTLGAPLKIYATREEGARMRASLWSGWVGRGVRRSDRSFMMGSPHLARPAPPFQSTFVPVEMTADEIVARFQAFKPTVIVGIVECIAMLARDVRARAVPERQGVRKIFAFGQTLSPHLTQLMQAGFNAEIFDLYGSTETSWMATECEHHAGLHLNVERSIVQIARLDNPDQPAPPGELGQVIVTSLMRRINPFIRYRLGDVAMLDPTPCLCGRHSPRLQAMEGRINDLLVAASGRLVPPAAIFLNLIHGRATISDHRLVQEARDRVRISIVPGTGFDDAERDRIRQVVRRHLGKVAVSIDLVEEIPRDPSGKRRRFFRAFGLDTSEFAPQSGAHEKHAAGAR